ncbi:MAG: SMI1/KNR4 family protein [Candidatus Thiodiazotropha sp.]|jgi:hypothetical protein
MPVLCNPPLSDESCRKLESTLGFQLPIDYKAFLKQWNGIFVSTPDYVDLPFEKVSQGEIAFTSLFGFQTANKNLEIIEQTNELKEDIEQLDKIVVIGDDGGDNFYLLVHRADGHNVFYWDRTHLHDEDPIGEEDIPEQDESGNIYLISKTFSSFWHILLEHMEGLEFINQEW